VLRAIVFDFDGVIANSEPLHFRAFREVLAESGVELSESDYYAKYLGYDDVGVFHAVAQDHGLSWNSGVVAAFVSSKAVRLDVLARDGAVLFPGAEAAIRRAAAATPLAIASGALGAEIRHVLRREGLTDCFQAIVAAEDTPVSKPAPDPYVRAVALLAIAMRSPLRPSDCVALEDSPWGLQSARTAGLRTVAVAQTYARGELEADLVIPTLSDLDVDALARLFPA
jgi:HAD superfamily hydrolase (TIGR01509 family)